MVLDDMEMDGVWKERWEGMWRPYMSFSVIYCVDVHSHRKSYFPYQHI